MTNDTRHRYLNDPIFHNMVNVLRNAIRELMLTPSEVREAAMLACVIEEERKPTRIHHVCEKAGMPIVVSPCLACELEAKWGKEIDR